MTGSEHDGPGILSSPWFLGALAIGAGIWVALGWLVLR